MLQAFGRAMPQGKEALTLLAMHTHTHTLCLLLDYNFELGKALV